LLPGNASRLMSKAAQGFSLRRTDSTPQTAFSQAAGANPRRTPLIGKRAIYGWKQTNTVIDEVQQVDLRLLYIFEFLK
jgi:hypothetical protein